MGKIIRKVIAILLTVTALILAVLPAKTADATTSTHGDYVYDGNTLVKYLGEESSVTIPDWITEVGPEAFANNTTLEKIVLPDSVREISNQAFENCSNLIIAKIPESVKTIGSSAFSGCTKLESINIPFKTKDLGSGVFANCKSLPSVLIDPNNEVYTCQDGVIYTKDGKELVQYLAGRPFTSYVMPSTIETIDEYAFWGASNLNKVSLSNSVEIIPEHAFDNCDGLSSIALPNSVKRLNAFSFADCDNLSSINIPETVGFIDPKAFYMTDGALVNFVTSSGEVIKTINAPNADEYISGEDVPDADSDEVTQSNEDNNTALSTQNSINNIPEDNINTETTDVNSPKYNGSYSGGAGWVNDISSLDYSDNVQPGELASSKIVGGSAYVFLPSKTAINDGYNLQRAETEDNFTLTSALYPDATGDETIIDGTYCSYNGGSINVNIPSGVNRIGTRAFYELEHVNNVTIPTGVTEIGDFSFARSGITNITIPTGTDSIGYGAFYNCINLENVSIPNSVKNIKLGAFSDTKFINNWKMDSASADFLIVGDNVLLAYKGSDSSVVIPGTVKHIAAGAFAGNKSITGVNIPSSVNDIGEEAFNNCTNLKEVKLNEGLYNIEDRAFKNTAVDVIYIPDSVTGIGLGAFDTTENGATLKTVIFSGTNMPDVTYNDTATRMSAAKLRTRAFEGVRNALIESDSNIDSGTIFDPEHYGFAGEIYSVDAESKDSNTLILERALSQPDENGYVNINSHVNIGGDMYILDNVKENAFDPYFDFSKWCKYRPTYINIEGNSTEALNSLLQSVNTNLYNIPDDANQGIFVNLSSNLFAPGSLANAAIPNCDDGFILYVNDNNEDKPALISAYVNAYGTYPDPESIYLSIDLFDKTGTIPIHKLGENKMEVALPVPSTLSNREGIKIACLDDNGILTELASEVTSFEGKNYIDFVTGHCSAYMIYAQTIYDLSDEAIDIELEESEGLYSFDSIMGTLHRESVKGIEVKWFVIVILLGIAGILLVYKPKKG